MDAREGADFLTRQEGLLTDFAFHAGLDQVWRCAKSRERSKNFAGRHNLETSQDVSKDEGRSEAGCDDPSVALKCISLGRLADQPQKNKVGR